ncbi:unnamed protein product (macronuclear) [Paramecium tetraurelia]|uniref:Protein kinase domain-containing protein n=1 Tax=Paramecium tetraurelia TaxID=5888 RepID=A0BYM4_PARTE|nr:uncharacterized protein GSPATT00033494001 [Paramecium tetraurelia]CAK63641.1 unnamed protein product [Paramecium tetraurelia]|eukprot:XP_001431039.1 hypothetical protein (macronuclear) [Paramecium tetraurelia strain d4-2]
MIQQFKIKGTKSTYIIYDKILGKGAYGIVLLAKTLNSGKQFDAKIINKKSLSPTDIVNLRNEINIQSKLSHANIVSMVDACEDNDYLYMLLEYCNGGCLFTNMQLNGPLNEEKAYKYFVQIVQAVQYLHSNKILHRDIKLSNLLLDKEDQIKLADFTWSTSLSLGYSSPQICGTTEEMPPEVIKKGFQNQKLDIWSLGIVLYEKLHNDLPKNGQFFLKQGISEECKQLMKQMLEVDMAKRPSAEEILSSPWIQKFQRNNRLIINTCRSYSGFKDKMGSPNKLFKQVLQWLLL